MANLIQHNQGTVTTWKDSGGSHVLTFKGLASGAGRQGVEHDFGVGVADWRIAWGLLVHFDTATAPVVGEQLDVFFKLSIDGVIYGNDDGDGTDIAVSTIDKLRNLKYLGSLIVDEAAADVPMVIQDVIDVRTEKIQPVIWNSSADNLDDDTSPTDSLFVIVAYPLEIQ